MKEQDQLLLQALEISPSPLFLLDRQGKVVLWNRASEVLTGVMEAEIINTAGHKQVFYPDANSPRPTLADILLTNKQEELHSLYSSEQNAQVRGHELCAEGWYFLSGQNRYVTFIASPVYSDEGVLVGVLETFSDITERQQDKEKFVDLFDQVCDAKKKWELTMDCIDDLVMVVDANENVQRCNRRVVDIIGCSFKEIVNHPWQKVLDFGGLVAAPGHGTSIEYHAPKTDRWFLLKKYDFPRSEQTEKVRTVITLHDLTETRRMTTELEEAHKELKATQGQILQSEKMASIGQLAAGVAHEINNPIGFVKSNLNSLGRYFDRLSSFIEKQEQVIADLAATDGKEIISKLRKESKVDFILEDVSDLQTESLDGIERVSAIVQNLKTFSRVDQAEFNQVDINACLESTLSIVWNELKYKITLEKDLASLPDIYCYPQQLNQVLLNLLVNAGQAIEDKGVIKLSTWQDGPFICLSVEDTGSGIPEENLPRLFEPFFTTKEVGKGTGLGLSISYDIISSHGGNLLVDSVVGKGTKFTIQLPLQSPVKAK